jgi:SAM-dependent methyltransferase
VGLDPLEADYVRLFPTWRSGVPTVAAAGELLPFPEVSFDVVLCENVIDHAERPDLIVGECVRVLAPGGRLFFSVNVHHGIYEVISRAYAAARAMGVRIEIGPFADHTVHLTPAAARRLIVTQPIRIVWQEDNVARARAAARTTPPRHLGDRVKRLFFKNARYEMVALKNGRITQA